MARPTFSLSDDEARETFRRLAYRQSADIPPALQREPT